MATSNRRLFYSRQSKVNPHIKDSVKDACKTSNYIYDEAVRGSPDYTVFEKIDKCVAFVADISGHDSCVLMELGYAVSKLGWDNIILLCDGTNTNMLPIDRKRIVTIKSSQAVDSNPWASVARNGENLKHNAVKITEAIHNLDPIVDIKRFFKSFGVTLVVGDSLPVETEVRIRLPPRDKDMFMIEIMRDMSWSKYVTNCCWRSGGELDAMYVTFTKEMMAILIAQQAVSLE